jgi:Fe-S-cluster containining protein
MVASVIANTRQKRQRQPQEAGHPADACLMADNLPDESALCQTCGLCCQGQLYSWVFLRPEEVALAEAWPVEMAKRADGISFKQPCGCFQEMRCTVYAQRPQTCVKYYCQLLGHLRQNEISQATALERVATARELFDQIEARLPAASAKRIWHRINERWDLQALQPLVASGELESDTLMAIVALDVYLTKYFRRVEAKLETADGGLKTGTDLTSALTEQTEA